MGMFVKFDDKTEAFVYFDNIKALESYLLDPSPLTEEEIKSIIVRASYFEIDIDFDHQYLRINGIDVTESDSPKTITRMLPLSNIVKVERRFVLVDVSK